MPDLGRVLGAQLLRNAMQLRIGPKLLGRTGVQLHVGLGSVLPNSFTCESTASSADAALRSFASMPVDEVIRRGYHSSPPRPCAVGAEWRRPVAFGT